MVLDLKVETLYPHTIIKYVFLIQVFYSLQYWRRNILSTFKFYSTIIIIGTLDYWSS